MTNWIISLVGIGRIIEIENYFSRLQKRNMDVCIQMRIDKIYSRSTNPSLSTKTFF